MILSKRLSLALDTISSTSFLFISFLLLLSGLKNATTLKSSTLAILNAFICSIVKGLSTIISALTASLSAPVAFTISITILSSISFNFSLASDKPCAVVFSIASFGTNGLWITKKPLFMSYVRFSKGKAKKIVVAILAILPLFVTDRKSAECILIKSAIAKPSTTEPPKEFICSSIRPCCLALA